MAASRHLSSVGQLKKAKAEFEVAAGTFQYMLDTFNNPPSADLSRPFLLFLCNLCLAQAQECVFQRRLLDERSQRASLADGGACAGVDAALLVQVEHVPAGEAGAVHAAYVQAWQLVQTAPLKGTYGVRVRAGLWFQFARHVLLHCLPLTCACLCVCVCQTTSRTSGAACCK